MSLAAVTGELKLDPGDAELLHRHFADPFTNPSTYDFVTLDGHRFSVDTRPNGSRRRNVCSVGLGLPGHEGKLYLGECDYEAWIAFSVIRKEVFACIPLYGLWSSGPLRTAHERL